MPLSSFRPDAAGFLYYGGFLLRGSSYDIQKVVILTVSESAILAGVQFSPYNVEGAAPHYYVGSCRFVHVRGGMIFMLPTLLFNVLIF